MTAGLGGVECVADETLLLPKIDYYLYESEPDILVVRRQEGSFVAAFSAQGATKEGILEVTKEDYRASLEANKDISRQAPSHD